MKFTLSTIAVLVLVSTQAHAENIETNPFTGARVETEQIRAQLEYQREKNSLSKEKLEEKRIEFQTKHAEKVMLADLKKMLAPTGSAAVLPGNYPAESALPPKAGSKKAITKPGSGKPDDVIGAMDGAFMGMTDGATAMAGTSRSAPVSWSPKLVAVMDNGRGRVAVIESGGEATTVSVGDSMAIGEVTDIGDNSVTIGGKTLVIDKTVVALNNPDSQNPASLTGGKAPTGPTSPMQGGIAPPGFQPGLVR